MPVFEVRKDGSGTEYLVPLRPVPTEPEKRRPLTREQQNLLKKLLILGKIKMEERE